MVPAPAAAALPAFAVTFLQWAPAAMLQIFFIAPNADVAKWRSAGTTGGMLPLSYFVLPGNAFLWLMYGAMQANMTLVAANSTGFVFGVWYAYNFMKYKPAGVSVAGPVAISASAVCVVAGANLLLPAAEAVHAVGTYGCVIYVAMLGAPLAALRGVVASGSTEALSPVMTAAAFVNCTLWLAFGWYLCEDPYIWGPNVIGLAIQVAGLLLFARFGLPKAASA